MIYGILYLVISKKQRNLFSHRAYYYLACHRKFESRVWDEIPIGVSKEENNNSNNHKLDEKLAWK